MKQYHLGINHTYHESSATLIIISDDQIASIDMIEEERLNRIKKGKHAITSEAHILPIHSIMHLLSKNGIQLSDVNHIGFTINPEDRYQMNSAHLHPYLPGTRDFAGNPGSEELYRNGLLSAEQTLATLGYTGNYEWFTHHDCHAASSYLASPFDDALVVVLDGIGEFDSLSCYQGSGSQLIKKYSVPYPNSIGFVWEKISQFLGFSEYDAGKVMGLAGYGNSKTYYPLLSHIFHTTETGFICDDAIWQFRSESLEPLSKFLGITPRDHQLSEWNLPGNDSVYADIAATIQKITEEVALSIITKQLVGTNTKNLCLSGGVALNCVLNESICQAFPDIDIYVQPAAHDAGTSLGAALLLVQKYHKTRLHHVIKPVTTLSSADSDIENIIKHYSLETIPYTPQTAAHYLAEGHLLFWFFGGCEWGPRALGHRSLLGDPRNPRLLEYINRDVKLREIFRPVCPSILAEHINEYLENPIDTSKTYSPDCYMLRAPLIKRNKRAEVPAIVHVDGSCRSQTVHRNNNHHYHELITAFYEITGIPMIANTSFNIQEPIVGTIETAIKTLLRSKVPYLCTEHYIIKNPNIYENN